MKNFNLGAINEWRQIGAGELLQLDCPFGGNRTVKFDLIADSHVSVRVVSGDDAWLVGAGYGQMQIRFVISEMVGLVVLGVPDADIFIRTHDAPQIIPESLDPSYTSIEPRPAGPSDDIRRMMHIMRLNEAHRQASLDQDRRAMRDEIEALRAAQNAPVVQSDEPVIEQEGQPDE